MYKEYMFWRTQGFSAVSSYYIARFGFMQYVGMMFDWE